MTAQEWLDALKQQENAATPGPYILDGMYPIYSLGRGGLKDKTVACANSKFDGDYIVAACNSVIRRFTRAPASIRRKSYATPESYWQAYLRGFE